MGWKNWPAWVKGGVIFSIISIGLIALVSVYSRLIHNLSINFENPFTLLILLIQDFLIEFPTEFLLNLFVGKYHLCLMGFGEMASIDYGINCPVISNSMRLIISFFTIIIFYFLIGSIIGFIIGKIKSKNQTQNLNKYG